MPVWMVEISNSYFKDPFTQQLLYELMVSPNSRPSFFLQQGMLKYKGRLVISDKRELRNQLLYQYHNSAVGGHSGVRATYERAKQHFCWPNMKRQILQWVQQCDIRQRYKTERVPTPGLLQPLLVPPHLNSHIHGLHWTIIQVRRQGRCISGSGPFHHIRAFYSLMTSLHCSQSSSKFHEDNTQATRDSIGYSNWSR